MLFLLEYIKFIIERIGGNYIKMLFLNLRDLFVIIVSWPTGLVLY